jgi:hypothetical protein
MDFAEIKQVRLVDVCLRLAIALKYRGEWATGYCPLPSHSDSKSKGTFAVNTKENYWVCHSDSCNKKAGKKGGDVISFVALKEGISDKQAAEKLAEWFGIKEAPHMAGPVREGQTTPHKTQEYRTSTSVEGKGYIRELNTWFDEFVRQGDQESGEDYLARLKKGFIGKVLESFRNGKRSGQGLPVS